MNLLFLTLLFNPRDKDEAISFIINIAMYGLPLIILILVAHHRLTRRLILHVDARALHIIDVAGRHAQHRSWSRSAIAEVKLNRSSNKLLIRITGQDMIEIFAASDPQITESVADIINTALHIPFESEAQSPPLAVPAAISPRARSALIVVSVTLVFIAIALCFLGFPWMILSFYLLLFSAIPAGIALGTQPKEYYFF